MFGATILPELEFGPMLFAPVELDGVQISLTGPAPGEHDRIAEPPEVPYFGLEHLGILTDDLDADLARFEEQGLTIYERRPGAGGFEIAFVATPDRVCVELLQAPREE
jgi:catechol 2,3-dioxygenase-like lactoylglutathione lyase family enzyme